MKVNLETIRNWSERIKTLGLFNALSLLLNNRRDTLYRLNHDGCRFLLRGKTIDFDVFNSIFIKGEYDINPGFSPAYIVDAGAFTGFSAVYFHRKYPGATIIAIQPEATNYNLLEKNIKCFREIQPVRGGLYGKAGDLIILDRDVEKYAFQVSESMETGEELPGYTIPLLMKKFDLPEIDILKMDIEGSEFSVFTNNPEEWLPRVRMVIAEIHEYLHPGVGDQIMGILQKSGFTIRWKGENLIAIRAKEIKGGEFPLC